MASIKAEKYAPEDDCFELFDAGEDISLPVIYDMLRNRFPALRFYAEDRDLASLIDGSITVELFPNSDRKTIRLKLNTQKQYVLNNEVCFDVLPQAGRLVIDMMLAIIKRAGRPAETLDTELNTFKRHIGRVFGGMQVNVHYIKLKENPLLNSWVMLLSFEGQYAQIVLPTNYYEKNA